MLRGAKVKYSLGKTINVGNFENVKLECGVELTCQEDELGERFEQAREFVLAKVQDEEYKWRV